LSFPERIEAFLCTCGKTLSRALNFESLKKETLGLPRISFCHIHDRLCQKEGLNFLKEEIQSSRPDAVLLGACSPRGRGTIFYGLMPEYGLNAQALEIVDLREGCAWVHADHPDAACAKALDLLRMGWARLLNQKATQDVVIILQQSALVLGGGPAGMAAASGMARQRLQVYLVEKDTALGGWLRRLSSVSPSGMEGGALLERLRQEVETSPLIAVLSGHDIASIKGNVGNFQASLRGAEGTKIIKSGVVVLATGAQPLVPPGLFRYGELKGVLTQEELEAGLLKGDDFSGATVFIQCAGSRIPERPYCSSICCPVALNKAKHIRLRWPQSRVFILHRDLMAPGIDLERLYHQAMEANVRFLRYSPEQPPLLEGEGRVERVKVFDTLSGRETILETDRVILSTPLVANPGNGQLAEILSVSCDRFGFFRDRSLLEPNRMAVPGVYTCGTSRWPCSVQEAITQGHSVAASVAALLRIGTAKASDFGPMEGVKGWPAVVKETACSGCGNCAQACPMKAIGFQSFNGRRVARVNRIRCTGCGTCSTLCSGGAIQTQTLSDSAATQMIREAFR
jgi:heterodisulfide reductase subunit A